MLRPQADKVLGGKTRAYRMGQKRVLRVKRIIAWNEGRESRRSKFECDTGP